MLVTVRYPGGQMEEVTVEQAVRLVTLGLAFTMHELPPHYWCLDCVDTHIGRPSEHPPRETAALVAPETAMLPQAQPRRSGGKKRKLRK
jgi:hypothetical protein